MWVTLFENVIKCCAFGTHIHTTYAESAHSRTTTLHNLLNGASARRHHFALYNAPEIHLRLGDFAVAACVKRWAETRLAVVIYATPNVSWTGLNTPLTSPTVCGFRRVFGGLFVGSRRFTWLMYTSGFFDATILHCIVLIAFVFFAAHHSAYPPTHTS